MVEGVMQGISKVNQALRAELPVSLVYQLWLVDVNEQNIARLRDPPHQRSPLVNMSQKTQCVWQYRQKGQFGTKRKFRANTMEKPVQADVQILYSLI